MLEVGAHEDQPADVREMGGALERVRASIAEVARKLAAYVRAHLERSRGRSGPDRGWSGEWRRHWTG